MLWNTRHQVLVIFLSPRDSINRPLSQFRARSSSGPFPEFCLILRDQLLKPGKLVHSTTITTQTTLGKAFWLYKWFRLPKQYIFPVLVIIGQSINQHSQSLCNKVSADPWVRRRLRRVGRRIISFPISVWLDRCKFQVLVCLCCRGKASDRVAAIRCDQIGLSNDFHLAVQYSGGTRFLVNERETRWYHRRKRRAFRSSVSKSTCSGSGPG